MTDDKSLKDKAIKIQNKNYVLVSDRVLFFNDNYPNGAIVTQLISEPTSEQIIVRASITPDADGKRVFTGYSQAVVGQGYINKTSALENCETSAVGRALAFMGIGVIESIASADEINKAAYSQPAAKPSKISALSLLRTKIGLVSKGAKIDEAETLKIIQDKSGLIVKRNTYRGRQRL